MVENVNRVERTRRVTTVAGLALLAVLCGCSAKRDLNATQPYILVTPTIANGIDLGQTLDLTASVISDTTGAGVTWAYAGPGTLTNMTPTGATYTAPAYDPTNPYVPASTTGNVLMVTSIAFPAFSVTFSFPVNPPPVVGTNATTMQGNNSGNTFGFNCAGFNYTNPSMYLGTAYSISPTTYYSAPATVAGTPAPAPSTTTGVPPFLWTVDSGTLPPGLFMNASSYQIQGTPTTAGTYTFTLAVTDAGSPPISVSSAPIIVAVGAAPPPAYYTGPQLPNGTTTLGSAAVSFSPHNPSNSVGCVQVGYSVSGPGIPAGATVAALSGSTITLSSSATSSGTGTITIINPNAAILPNATATTSYSHTLQSIGGGGIMNWVVSAGSSLPTGMILVSNSTTNNGFGINPVTSAALTGTPTIAGTYTFSLTATDSVPGAGAQMFAQTFTLTVLPAVALTITTTTLPPAPTVLAPHPQVPQQGVLYSQTMAATGGSTPYAWTVTSGTLPSGLSLSSLGTLSGTPTTLGTAAFTVSATDSTNPSQTATQSYAMAIMPGPLAIATTTISGDAQGTPYNQQLKTTGGLAPITWSINSGSLPGGLTLNGTTGVISGKPTGLGSYGITVQAQDSSTPSPQTVSRMLTINITPPNTGINNGVLKGSYGFLTNGFDSGGNPLALIGSFTADGKGNITMGSEDMNGSATSPPQSNLPVTGGSYLIGGDNRGTMTLTTSAGSSNFAVALDTLSAAIAGGGRIASFDPSGQGLAGSFYMQDPTAFSSSALSGGYTFGFSGFAGATSRAAMIGEVQIDGAGNISSGLEDSNYAGTVAANVAIGSGSSYTVSASGRGTETLSIGSGSVPLVFYVISANRLLVASSGAPTASNPLLSGQQLKQTVASFANTTLGGKCVIRQEKLSPKASDIQLGLIDFDTAGTISLYSSDENSGGTVTTNSLPATGASYAVASTGRTAVTGGGALPAVLYLVGQNQGFLIDASSSVAFGSIDGQSGSPFTTLSMVGNYALGTADPLLAGVGVVSGVFTGDGSKAISGAQDVSTSGVLSGAQTLAGIYTIASNGRGMITLTGAVAGSPGTVVYIISPTRAVLLDLSSSSPTIQAVDHQ